MVLSIFFFSPPHLSLTLSFPAQEEKEAKVEPQPEEKEAKVGPQSCILILPCSNTRLENIDPDTGGRLQDEEFWLNGSRAVRKAGKPGPESLLQSWRDVKRENPELFQTLSPEFVA